MLSQNAILRELGIRPSIALFRYKRLLACRDE